MDTFLLEEVFSFFVSRCSGNSEPCCGESCWVPPGERGGIPTKHRAQHGPTDVSPGGFSLICSLSLSSL